MSIEYIDESLDIIIDDIELKNNILDKIKTYDVIHINKIVYDLKYLAM